MWAEREIKLARRRGKSSEREHLERLWKATGKRPKALPGPCPEGFWIVWDAFARLSRRRGGGMGPAAIAHRDIDAFCRVACVPLCAWQVELVEQLDDIWMKVHG